MKEVIIVDGVEYVRRQPMSEGRVIIRSKDSGVHFGTLVSRSGDEVQLSNARRIWYWDGAATLSELAISGTSAPKTCKFPAPVPSITILGVCEVIECTEAASKSIDGVKAWSQH